jgi:hypothetical protein
MMEGTLKKLILTVLAIAACGGLVVSGTATARGLAPTTVTIKTPGGDVYGTVKSPKPQKCANGRKVSVFKVKSGKDEKVGSDIAQANNNEYQWNIGQPGVNGNIYARARQTDQCEGDKSPISDA